MPAPDASRFDLRHALVSVARLGSASVLVKPLWMAFLVVACPRVLGAEGYGTFSAALAVASIALVAVDLGMTSHSLREVARRPSHGARYLSNFLPLRLALLAVGVVGMALWVALGPTSALAGALVLAVLYRAAETLSGYGRVFLVAAEDHAANARSIVAERVLTLAAGAGLLVLTKSAVGTLAGLALGAGAFTAGLFTVVARRYARFERRLLSGAFLRRSARLMAPLALAELLTVLYLRVDQVMIEAFLGAAEAGVYALPYRLLETLVIVPAVVVQSVLYPRMSKLAEGAQWGELRRILAWGAAGLLAISAVLVGGLWLGGDALVGWIVPEAAFARSGGVLRVLSLTFPLTCLSNLFFFFFLSVRRQRITLVALGGAAALNVGLNLVAIPRFGIEGAVWATILSEALIVAVYLVRLPFELRHVRAAGARQTG